MKQQPLTLRIARVISYSQVFEGEIPTIESLVMNIPSDEAVEWCSYIVFKKDNLKIGENDLHILMPLIFSFENELQHKIIKFLGNYYNGIDCLIDKYSMLKLTSFLIAHRNDEHHNLTENEKTRLFKAYLVYCDKYLERISSVKPIPEKYTSEDMLECYLPIKLLTNNIESYSDPSIELVKGKWFFVDFAKTDSNFKQYVDDFVRIKGYNSAIEYLGYIFNLVGETIVHEPPTNIIKFDNESGKWTSFMNGMSVNLDDFDIDDDLKPIRSKPVYRIGVDRYAILFSKFFIEKMFNGMLFDMAETLSSIGTFEDRISAYKALKQQVGERFSEQYILYRTLENTLSRRFPIRKRGEELLRELKEGEPDFYARRNNRVFVFEFKDVRMDSETKISCDYESIRQKLYNCFVESDKGRPKGVRQLVRDIEKKLPEILSKTDIVLPGGQIKVYPIIVYTDDSFDIEGVNYYLNYEFRKFLNVTDDKFQIKDMVMVNINLLMKLENYFINGRIDFDKVLNDYLAYKKNKEVFYTIPFNKYLFQYARRKGFNMMFTSTFKKTYSELLKIEQNSYID